MLIFVHMIDIQGSELYFGDFTWNRSKIGLYFFQTWHDGKHDKTLHFDTSVNDFDHHSWSQGYEKAETCAVILL